MTAAFPPVVRAIVKGHRAVAVRCSTVPSQPWLVIDVDKEWTLAAADADLEDRVELEPVVSPPSMTDLLERWANPAPYSPGGWLDGGPYSASDSIPADDRWRIWSGHFDDEVFEGDPAEVWAALVSAVDDAWTVDIVEQLVAESWQRRSLRDLLDAAGGGPL